MKTAQKRAFTVGELMIIMLVVSIIMAAFMPVMTKRRYKEKTTTASTDYWQYASDPNIYFSDAYSDDDGVLIGVNNRSKYGWRSTYNSSTQLGKLIVSSSYQNPYQIIFRDTTGNYTGKMFAGGPTTEYPTIGLGDVTVSAETTSPYRILNNCAIAIGSGYTYGGSTYKTSATGNYATAIGQGSKASGEYSIAIGVNDDTKGQTTPTTASADYAIAIGTAAQAIQIRAIALGPSTQATALDSIAIGRATASGSGSIAIGSTTGTTASGEYAIAIGNTTNASADYAIAMGSNVNAINTGAIAIGKNSGASNPYAIAIGNGARTSTYSGNSNSISIGALAGADIYNCMYSGTSIGFRSFAKGVNDLAIGPKVTTSGSTSGSDPTWTDWDYIMSIYGGLDEYEVTERTNGVQTYYERTIRFSNAGVIIPGYLYVQGNTVLTVSGQGSPFTSSSDIRLKNIKSPFSASIDSINDINTYNYVYKQDPYKKEHIGIIAQDFQKKIPNAVRKDNRGYLCIDTNYIFYTMINSIKELNTKISMLLSKTQNQLAKIMSTSDKLEAYIESYKTLFNQIQTIDKDESKLEYRLAKLEKKAGKIR